MKDNYRIRNEEPLVQTASCNHYSSPNRLIQDTEMLIVRVALLCSIERGTYVSETEYIALKRYGY